MFLLGVEIGKRYRMNMGTRRETVFTVIGVRRGKDRTGVDVRYSDGLTSSFVLPSLTMVEVVA